MLLSFAHSMSMKQPVALQSMRACVHHLTVVSVDSISTFTRRESRTCCYNILDG
jgi:hypothetical protein